MKDYAFAGISKPQAEMKYKIYDEWCGVIVYSLIFISLIA